jgi:hypothetical protein
LRRFARNDSAVRDDTAAGDDIPAHNGIAACMDNSRHEDNATVT